VARSFHSPQLTSKESDHMTTLTLKNQLGALGAIQTRDAVRYDGSGMTPRPSDITAMQALRDTGLLSPAATAEIDKILGKFGGAQSGSNTSQAGITSIDRATEERDYNNRRISEIRDEGNRQARVQLDAALGR
ncbi:MAG: hypothetical protein ABI145_15400, partial [Steroidobacteraceae bacterium]